MFFTHQGHKYMITDYIRMHGIPYGYEVHRRDGDLRPTYVENTARVIRRFKERFFERWGWDYTGLTIDEMMEMERKQQADDDEYREWMAVQETHDELLAGTGQR